MRTPPPPPLPLTVQRLCSSAVAADVFDLLPDHERHVVVVCGGLMLLLLERFAGGAAAGLHPGQAEGSPPLPRFLLLGHRRRCGVGGGSGP